MAAHASNSNSPCWQVCSNSIGPTVYPWAWQVWLVGSGGSGGGVLFNAKNGPYIHAFHAAVIATFINAQHVGAMLES
jgi:hypothetical protein